MMERLRRLSAESRLLGSCQFRKSARFSIVEWKALELRDEVFHYFSMDIGEPEIAALKPVGQALVIKA